MMPTKQKITITPSIIARYRAARAEGIAARYAYEHATHPVTLRRGYYQHARTDGCRALEAFRVAREKALEQLCWEECEDDRPRYGYRDPWREDFHSDG